MKKIFTFILFSISVIIFAQTKISGKVVDGSTNKPVAFADIMIPNSSAYVSTNSDGSFYLEVPFNAKNLSIAGLNYSTQIIDLQPGANYDLVVKLVKSKDQLSEVVVKGTNKKYKNKKENPAYAILREVWKRRKTNGLARYKDYQYDQYEKIEFDLNNIDSALMKKKIFRKMEFIFNNIDTSSVTGKAYLPMFLNETLSKVAGTNQPIKNERVDLIASKTSGFDNNEIVAQTVKNLYKEYNIYDNRLNFFNKAFTSPIATDGFSVYEYNLIDTLMVDGVKCYKIKYFPKRDSEFTFKGSLFISFDSYAVKDVTMHATKGINVNFVKDIYVDLEYDLVNDETFLPKKTYIMLDMSLFNKKKESKGIYAHKTVTYKNYDFTTVHDKKFYATRWDPYLEGAYVKTDDFWNNNRHEALKKSETNIYSTLDSLKKVPKFNRIVNVVQTVGSGYLKFNNFFEIGNFYNFLGFNNIEGTRVKLGGRTYITQNDFWRIGGYIAYGFQDDKFKYGVEGKYMFNKYSRFILGAGIKRDVEQLGAELTTDDGILTRSFGSSALLQRGDNNLLSNRRLINVFSSIQVAKNFELKLDATQQDIESTNSGFNINYLKDGIEKHEVRDTHVGIALKARPTAIYSQFGIDRYEHTSLSPTILVKYIQGFENIFDSDFKYSKIQAYYKHPVLVGGIGRSDISLEAGKTFGKVPLSLLSIIPANQSYSVVANTFSQLNYYEMITDTYISMVYEHHFNGRILSYIPFLKKLQLREIAFFRGVYGTISDENKSINASNIPYFAPSDHIYYEYGCGLENIGVGNWRIFRVDFNWRGNYLDRPNVSKFGVKFGIQVTF